MNLSRRTLLAAGMIGGSARLEAGSMPGQETRTSWLDRVEPDILTRLAEYGDALDGGDLEAWRNCFTSEATLEFFGRNPDRFAAAFGGRASRESAQFRGRAIADFWIRHRALLDFPTKHIVVGARLSSGGDGRIAARSTFLRVDSRGGECAIAVFGRYEDVLRRIDGVWRFELRRAFIESDAELAFEADDAG